MMKSETLRRAVLLCVLPSSHSHSFVQHNVHGHATAFSSSHTHTHTHHFILFDLIVLFIIKVVVVVTGVDSLFICFILHCIVLDWIVSSQEC